MLKLLIVDDETIIREALSESIDYQALGYQLIATAKNGMEAYDVICDEYPDVVITDIRMPILDGLGLIQKAKDIDSDVSFILLSGYGEFEYARQAMAFGVKHYLLKPTDPKELQDALLELRAERTERSRRQDAKQRQLLKKMQAPLEQGFIMEALSNPENFSQIFDKYRELLHLSEDLTHCCICTFIEDEAWTEFCACACQGLAERKYTFLFPVIGVRHTLLFLTSIADVRDEEDIAAALKGIKLPKQRLEPEVLFLHAGTPRELFGQIIKKISRYEQIYLIDQQGRCESIHNQLVSPGRVRNHMQLLQQAASQEELRKILDSFLPDSLPLDSACILVTSMFMGVNAQLQSEKMSLDNACDFFRKLYCMNRIEQMRGLLEVLLTQNLKSIRSKQNTYVELLKTLVEQRLSEENLSLKWLAENLLFVSVGYLSKQFVKETGTRFSDYLNQCRMRRARELMSAYRNPNIKDIAQQVGFGNNPQYFSQVFKKYCGLTPSDFMSRLTEGMQETGTRV